MENIYLIIVIVLIALAISDLVVGVSNDAVNFLNSAVGSKAASFRLIMFIAACGIIVGATFSSGMMEVARKGIFHPNAFNFSDIMIIFLAVMITDVLLLDLFNTFGLPTSTTVSIVFELLGAAVALSVIKITKSVDAVQDMGHYINSGKALAIISGILLSVVIAFTVGAIVQFIARLIFSFRYKRSYKYFGALWGGFAISAITYFILIKGAKGSSFITPENLEWIKDNTLGILLISFVSWTFLLQILISLFKVNILKLIVLVGTFALAMAFAGNDLVNFIGVPLAGLESFNIFNASDISDPSLLSMDALKEKIQTPTLYLIFAGLIMVITLWTSKKAKSVTKTELSLGHQDEDIDERFASSFFARRLVRRAINVKAVLRSIMPAKVLKAIDTRFKPLKIKKSKRKDAPAFDLIRASVNLVVASILISVGTSHKLPLSTTYVTFMVAMGSSLADGAWGRESAVYRITGVLTVIGGWFFTAFSAFTCAFILASLISWGGIISIGILIALAIFFVVKTHGIHKKREKETEISEREFEMELDKKNIFSVCNKNLAEFLSSFSKMYKSILDGLINERLKKLRKLKKDLKTINAEIKKVKNNRHKVIEKLHDDAIESGHYYIQVLDYLSECAGNIKDIYGPVFQYVDNNHPPLIREQEENLKNLISMVGDYYAFSISILSTLQFDKLNKLQKQQKAIIDFSNKLVKRQIKMIKKREVGTRNSIIYIEILNETKSLSIHLYSLMSAQFEFLDYSNKA